MPLVSSRICEGSLKSCKQSVYSYIVSPSVAIPPTVNKTDFQTPVTYQNAADHHHYSRNENRCLGDIYQLYKDNLC